MIKISLRTKNLKTISEILLSKEIHNCGMMLEWYREEVWDYKSIIKAISLAYSGREIIGACVLINEPEWDNQEFNIGVYIKPDFRRRGIGRRLVERIKKFENNVSPWKEEEAANKFYSSINL